LSAESEVDWLRPPFGCFSDIRKGMAEHRFLSQNCSLPSISTLDDPIGKNESECGAKQHLIIKLQNFEF
jgi:hypothetical protein